MCIGLKSVCGYMLLYDDVDVVLDVLLEIVRTIGGVPIAAMRLRRLLRA